MKAFDNPLGLRTLDLGAGMVDVLDRQIQFIFMTVRTPTLLRAAIGEKPVSRHFMVIKERNHLIVEEIGSG